MSSVVSSGTPELWSFSREADKDNGARRIRLRSRISQRKNSSLTMMDRSGVPSRTGISSSAVAPSCCRRSTRQNGRSRKVEGGKKVLHSFNSTTLGTPLGVSKRRLERSRRSSIHGYCAVPPSFLRFLSLLAVFLTTALVDAAISVKKSYSTNFMCIEKSCVNPIFPAFRLLGVSQMEEQEKRDWNCITGIEAKPGEESPPKEDNVLNFKNYASFCKSVLKYDFAVPDWIPGTSSLEDIIETENRKAVEAYISQLDGLGYEYLENREPWDYEFTSPCLYRIYQMACYTYFPKCGVGSSQNKFIRPCSGVCDSYLNDCDVRCCDEGTSCVFEHKERLQSKTGSQSMLVTIKGYVDHPGPSLFCTGSAKGRGSPKWFCALALTLFLCMQGAAGISTQRSRAQSRAEASSTTKTHAAASSPSIASIFLWRDELFPSSETDPVEVKAQQERARLMMLQDPTAVAGLSAMGAADTILTTDIIGAHSVPRWRKKEDFTMMKQSAADKVTRTMGLSSCNNANIPDAYKCSRRGVCVPFDPLDATPNAYMVCRCDPSYAGLECKVERQSQLTAYGLSVFGGVFGLDRFYLGEYAYGSLKLFTLGGLGFWWMYDIVWIGSGPVYAHAYRLATSAASDILPIVFTPLAFIMIGVYYAVRHLYAHKDRKRRLARDILNQYDIEQLTTHKHALGSL